MVVVLGSCSNLCLSFGVTNDQHQNAVRIYVQYFATYDPQKDTAVRSSQKILQYVLFIRSSKIQYVIDGGEC